MASIEFVGIGAPKCGTTWISAQLAAHPEIGFAPAKEVYYFADTIARRMAGEELGCFKRGVEWYHEQFPPLDGTIRLRGEFCPSYLYSAEAAHRLVEYAPDIKLIVCLRPPVDMIYSWYWYNRNGVVVRMPPAFSEAMELPLVRDLGKFAFHLRPYLDRFPAKNILVIEFGAIKSEPARARREIYRFLGVDPDFEPVGGDGEKNSARASRFGWLQTTARRVHDQLRRMPGTSRLLQSPWVARVLEQAYHRVNSRQLKYPALSPEERLRWTSYYAADQEELEEMLRGLSIVRATESTWPAGQPARSEGGTTTGSIARAQVRL